MSCNAELTSTDPRRSRWSQYVSIWNTSYENQSFPLCLTNRSTLGDATLHSSSRINEVRWWKVAEARIWSSIFDCSGRRCGVEAGVLFEWRLKESWRMEDRIRDICSAVFEWGGRVGYTGGKRSLRSFEPYLFVGEQTGGSVLLW